MAEKYKFNADTVQKIFNCYNEITQEEENLEYNKNLDLKIENIIENHFLKKKPEVKNKFKFNFNPLIPISAISTVCIIAIFIIFFQIAFQNNLTNELSITEYNKKNTTAKIYKNTTFQSIDSVKIESDKAVFFLKEKSNLEIKNTKNILSNKSNSPDHYYLKHGIIYVNADKLNTNEKLYIYTDFGDCNTPNAKYMMSYFDNKLILECFEGSVEFHSKDNNMTVIKENEKLIQEKIEKKFIITISKIKNQKYPKSEILRKTNINNIINPINLQDTDDKLQKFIPIASWSYQIHEELYNKFEITNNNLIIITNNKFISFNKQNGNRLGSMDKNNNLDKYIINNNYMAYQEDTKTINIYSIPYFYKIYSASMDKDLNEIPVIFDNFLIVCINNSIHIYDFIKKELITKYEFNSNITCCPYIIDNDKILLCSQNNDLILFSLKTQKIIWKYKSNNKFLPGSLIINKNNSNFAIIDESQNIHVFDINNNSPFFIKKISKDLLVSFINNNLLIYTNNNFTLYNMQGEAVKSNTYPLKFKNIYYNNGIIYALSDKYLKYYNEELNIINSFKIVDHNNIINWNFDNNNLYLITDDYKLTRYSLEMGAITGK